MACPLEKAMPIISTGLFRTSSVVSEGSTIRDLVVILLMGIVVFGAAPAGTQPQSLSGIRYADFTQNPSKGLVRTAMLLRDFTQYVAYQPGTISLAGKP